MIPVFAIIGRPNVGKSTLFNRLTKSLQALVINIPGVTRDRIYGEGRACGKTFILIDTGGLDVEETGLDQAMAQQTRLAIDEADQVFFIVDARAGVLTGDLQMAARLREQGKTVNLLVNKTDGLNPDLALADFYQLGLGEPRAIAASHNRGITSFINAVMADYVDDELAATTVVGDEGDEGDESATVVADNSSQGIKIAVVGRPNVGKSTLVNRLLGEDRVVVYDEPGTTRDSITIDSEREGKSYRLVDTAGIRRRARVNEIIEKFSVVKTLKAIEEADVVVLMIDAASGLLEQDLKLLGFVLQSGRAMVLAVNKWDGLPTESKDSVRKELDRRCQFMPYIEKRLISAKHGTGVGHLFELIERAHACATKKLATPLLTKLLQQAVQAVAPPLSRGRRIKLRYAHAGGGRPPRIVIHGNQVAAVPESYRRYLTNMFREKLNLVGTPVVVEFKSGENPYADRKNQLTERQLNKRRRMKKYLKKKSK